MKTDFEILGLPENASKDVVERKYGILIRQYKARTDEHGVMDEDAKYYQKITGAYNRIMGLDPNNYDDNPTSVVPYKIRRFGGKLSTLFDQYKLVLMIVVFIIAAVVIVIVQSRTVTEYDLNIKFIGSFDTLNEAEFSQKVSEKSAVSDTAAVSFYTITTESGYSPDNLSAATQFQSQLIYGQLDIILMDQEGWNVYKNQKAFYQLDDILKEEAYASKIGDFDTVYYERTYDQDGMATGPESGIYAIDITDTTFFDNMELEWFYDEKSGQQKSLYVAICGTTKNLDRAKAFLAELLDY